MIAPGKYWLVARDEVRTGLFYSQSTLYYPGVRDRNLATPISIEAGNYSKNLDMHIPATEIRHVMSGQVRYADGAPAPNARLTFSSPEHGYAESASTSADGAFTLPVTERTAIVGNLEHSTISSHAESEESARPRRSFRSVRF